MTDITDEQIKQWAAKASVTGWLSVVADERTELLRRFAELARQDEREACIDIVAFHGGSVDIEAHIRSRGSDK